MLSCLYGGLYGGLYERLYERSFPQVNSANTACLLAQPAVGSFEAAAELFVRAQVRQLTL